MSKINTANLKKTYYYLKRNGLKETCYAAAERLWGEDGRTKDYSPKFVSKEEQERQRQWIPEKRMLFSIVVPTYRTNAVFLRDMIDSVRNQSYGNWELLIADATEDESVKSIVTGYADERIRYLKLGENKGISENTNAGIAQAEGDYIGLLDHDDILEPDALYEMAQAIQKQEKNGVRVRLLYSDEDKCNEDRSEYYDPNFKENYNYDLILTNNYICHFLVSESALLKKLELRKQYDGAQDYDLVLRALPELEGSGQAAVHIPKVLYHWRCHEKSTAENPQSKSYAYEAGRRALQDYADRNHYRAQAVSLKHVGFYKLRYKGDIFDSRKDIGAVGGRLVADHKVIGGCMDENGKVRYQGLQEHQSGYLHRAVLMQNAVAVDVRCIRISPKYRGIFEKITGILYTEDSAGFFDYAKLPSDTDFKALSLEICKEIRSDGAKILYSPDNTRRIGDKSAQTFSCKKTQKADKFRNTHEITIVIPNYNGIRFLEGCMESLLAEKNVPGTPKFRILVVDNNSTDGSRRQLRERWPDAKKIFLPENTGFCHAVNLGIQNADSPYVILLNNDTKIRPGFVKYLYRAVTHNKKAFSVGAKMLMWDDPNLVDDAGDYYCVFGWAYSRGKGQEASLYDRKAEVFSACGGAAIYKKEVFEEIGLFDERHFAYLEDLDIGYRARIHGYRNYYEPKAQVIHYGSASTGSRYNAAKTGLAAANNVYVIFKNMPLLQRIFNAPFLLAGFFIKFLFFCKKKMGALYLKGLFQGFRKSLDREGRSRRVPFRLKYLRNYVKIQLALYGNVLRFLKKS